MCTREGTGEPKKDQGTGVQEGRYKMSATRTYKVKGMRVLLPSDKTREKNPDLKFTVVGEFFNEDGQPLTIPQKAITTDMLPNVTVNIEKGLLTVPAGQRGAPKRESASQSVIDELLAQAKSK